VVDAGLATPPPPLGTDLVDTRQVKVRANTASGQYEIVPGTMVASSPWLIWFNTVYNAEKDENAGGGGMVSVTPVAGHVQFNLDLATNFTVTMDGTVTNFDPPFTSSGSLTDGDDLYLFILQDATGLHPLPVFSTAAGGWTSDTQAKVNYVPTASTATILHFKRLNGVWIIVGVNNTEMKLS